MAETLAEVAAQLDQVRSEANRHAWLAMRIRERCLADNAAEPAPTVPRLLREVHEEGVRPQVLEIEAYILAEHFHCLPEPERSALSLFYLDLFSADEIAAMLKFELEDMGALLSSARARLQSSLMGSEVTTG